MKKNAGIKENEVYILPSDNKEMRTFISKFKIDMMDHVVLSIKFAIDNKLPLVEVFQFKDSPFVITIAKKEFESNLSHINKYFMENEAFELCPKIEKLQEILKGTNNNEKKRSDDNNKPDSTK